MELNLNALAKAIIEIEHRNLEDHECIDDIDWEIIKKFNLPDVSKLIIEALSLQKTHLKLAEKVLSDDALDAYRNQIPENFSKPVLKIKHSELKRSSDSSIYRSICPVCENGTLLVGRFQDTLILSDIDYCILCGQTFQYTDIEELRREERE